VFDRWLRSGDQQAPRPGSLWQATGSPQVGAGIPARDSILAPPQPRDDERATLAAATELLRHGAAVAGKAVKLAGYLRRPLQGVPTATPAGAEQAQPHEPASTSECA
jgi:hypothetical protein